MSRACRAIRKHCENGKLQQENEWLREVIAARNRRLFGRKSEKLTAEAEPVLEKLKNWLDVHLPKTAPQSMLFGALRYMRNEWEKLTRYLDHAWLRPDNNIIENIIRYFVIGRKNWLFANTPLGAHASATLYSFITAWQWYNGLNLTLTGKLCNYKLQSAVFSLEIRPCGC